ncbi:potassium transporter TrkG [uncultured Cohaesibacter sp.]|uniref:TrkH family potassium uptake protein n=1 Tax=uncultured Cohaesibacter sp. TaxID=1002546 RepID=UPI00292D79EA|nr:potassium transporter TrkG [uncultured Cohaesibacter sp.]
MLPTALVALSAGNLELAESFLLMSGLIGFLSGGIYFALRGQEREMVNHQTFLLCVIAWFGLSVAGAFPFVLSDQLSWGDGFFEAASGLSTTGASVFLSLAETPKAIIFWRAILQWYGGLLTLVSFLMVLAPAGVGGMREVHSRLMEQSLGDDIWRSFSIIRQIAAAYSLVTLVLAWLLILTGLPPFDSMCLAFSTISTGGFLPVDGTLGVYDNSLADLVVAFGMLMGASSLLWHRMVVRGKWQFLVEHRESYIFIFLVLATGLLYSITLFQLAGNASVLPATSALRQGFFTAVSLISTTGFELRYADVTVLPGLLVFSLAFIGATHFSTAGGIKIYRFGVLVIQVADEVARLVYPNRIRAGRLGRPRPSMQLLNGIWSSLILTIILIAVVAGIVTFDIGQLDGGIIAAVSSFSNIGPLYNTGWGPAGEWPSYFEMSMVTKMSLAITMIIGRIEVIVLLGALNFRFWNR